MYDSFIYERQIEEISDVTNYEAYKSYLAELSINGNENGGE